MRVLFVDDEEKVLSALSRAFRKPPENWEISFANSGHEALEKFEIEPFDVIVSDMMMPQMSGDELLQAISAQFPDTARIILSGQCNQATAFRLVGSDHLYLAKPCSPALLIDTVNQAHEISKMKRQAKEKPDLEMLQSGIKDLLSLFLMRNIITIEDIPESLRYLLSEKILNCFAPTLSADFELSDETISERTEQWLEKT
ncbi:MAG: response regulator [Alphaproteobacteria bacterium]|nr:response regulator [Rhodospirillales bacterium]MCW9045854.1 response regulator [Alphaproteobacteria bacterium]